MGDPIELDTVIALLMHHFPKYGVEDIKKLSYRQINNMLESLGKMMNFLNPDPKKSKGGGNAKPEVTRQKHLDEAKGLGCKNPEDLING